MKSKAKPCVDLPFNCSIRGRVISDWREMENRVARLDALEAACKEIEETACNSQGQDVIPCLVPWPVRGAAHEMQHDTVTSKVRESREREAGIDYYNGDQNIQNGPSRSVVVEFAPNLQ